MSRRSPSRSAFSFLALLGCLPAVASGQDPDSVRIPADMIALDDSSSAIDAGAASWGLPDDVLLHLGHVTEEFSDTPAGMSLLETALAEAEIAAAWVRVAGRDSLGLGRMQSSMTNVLHALDPTQAGTGAGLGYGVRRAAEGIERHVELAMQGDSLPAALAFHGPYVLRAARGARTRLDDAVALARQIQTTRDTNTALRLIRRLRTTVRAVAYGADSDGDGRIGQTEAEVGIAQAAYHLGLVYRSNGLPAPDVRPDSIIDAMGLREMGRAR